MILFLISSFGACKDKAKLVCIPNLPYSIIPFGRPQVETVICLAPIPSPNGLLAIRIKSMTLSKLSKGSPVPMTLIWVTDSPLSSNIWLISINSPTISEVSNPRFFFNKPEAQKAHPIEQPTSLETQIGHP